MIPVAEPDIGQKEEDYLLKAFRSGWISSLGTYIRKFEEDFAKFCKADYAVSVSNGTVALHLALVANEIGAGDEVIVPSLTFVATAAAVKHAGATPVFADCEPDIGTIDPAAVARAITSKTRAIIAVHLYGHPAEMEELQKIAHEHGLLLIEDAAEAHGALYRGRPVGGLGDVATFSFYGNKVLTTGEGGVVVTSSEVMRDRLILLRDHAMSKGKRYWHDEVGYNYRLTNLQAAIGVAQLERYDELSEKRQNILSAYRQSGLEDDGLLIFNPKEQWASPVMWLVCAILPESTERSARDVLCAYLKQQGIDTRPYFVPLHLLPPYQDCRRVNAIGGEDLHATELLACRGFNLPSSTSISHSDIEYVGQTIRSYMSRK